MLKIKQTNRVITINKDTNEVLEYTNFSVLSEHMGISLYTLKGWFRRDPKTNRFPTVKIYKNYEIRRIKHVYTRDNSAKL